MRGGLHLRQYVRRNHGDFPDALCASGQRSHRRDGPGAVVGAFVGCVLGAFFILVDNPLQAVWFVVMFQVLQQIENNMIYPRVVGTSIGLPGMWVLMAVTIGGNLMGVGGMLLMIPLASVAYTLAREFTDRRLKERNNPDEKVQDQPPELQSEIQGKTGSLQTKEGPKKAPALPGEAEQITTTAPIRGGIFFAEIP